MPQGGSHPSGNFSLPSHEGSGLKYGVFNFEGGCYASPLA